MKRPAASISREGNDECFTTGAKRDVEVFKAVFPLFQDWLPVDYHTLVDMNRNLKGTVFSKCLYMLMVWGKETEWRMKLCELQNALAAETRLGVQQLLSQHGPSAAAAGKIIWKLLQKVLVYMSTVDRSWSKSNLHRRVGRVLSWLPLLQKFGVLSKSKSGYLNFGSKENYTVEPYDDAMLEWFQRIERFCVVHYDLFETATDFCEYEKYTENVKCSTGMVFEDGDGYIGRFSARAALICMRQAPHLVDFDVPASCTCQRFARTFPDQASHVTDFAAELNTHTMKQLSKALGYNRSLFFFTMYQCLLLDPHICSIPLKVLKSEQFATSVKKVMRQTTDAYGHAGLPATICKKAAAVCM